MAYALSVKRKTFAAHKNKLSLEKSLWVETKSGTCQQIALVCGSFSSVVIKVGGSFLVAQIWDLVGTYDDSAREN